MTDILINIIICFFILAVVISWITETSWFWRMMGYSKKKNTKTEIQHYRNWYGRR